MSDPRRRDGGGDVAVVTEKKTKTKLARPKLYKVILHNDDYTTMEFVVAVLQTIFHHSEGSAEAIMLHIHRHGIGVAGIYPYAIAEAKVGETLQAAEKAEYPLMCTMEPDDGNGGGGDEGDGDGGGDFEGNRGKGT
jgi:ATP-dependent Clp protease adaptor protein ClpS